MRTIPAFILFLFGPGMMASALDPVPGFPLSIPVNGSLMTIDLTGDDDDEILAGSYSADYFVLEGTGVIASGWPFPWVMGNPGAYSPPMAGDVDGDGVPDIVYTGSSSSIGRKLMVLDHMGVPKPGWPIDVGENIHMQWDFIALGDLDGDGDSEIVWPSRITWSQRQVFAFQGDGTPVAGWPEPIPEPPGYAGLFDDLSGLAVGDLDGDGADEVIVCAYASSPAGNTLPSVLWVYDGDGTLIDTWIMPLGYWVWNPIIVDIDRDGDMEVIAAGTHRVFWLDHEGNEIVPSMSVTNSWHGKSCADVDGDGDRELLSGGIMVRVIDHELGVVSTYSDPQYYDYGDPSVADLDGDGEMEIAFWAATNVTTHLAHLIVTDDQLQMLPGYPIVLPIVNGFGSKVVAFGDLGGDGTLEIVSDLGGAQQIHAWTFAGPSGAAGSIEWHGANGDATNSRWFDRGRLPAPPRYRRGDANQDGSLDISDVIHTLGYQFLGWPHECAAALDVDGDDQLLLNDPIASLGYLFQMGAPPVAPGWPGCAAAVMGALPCEWVLCP